METHSLKEYQRDSLDALAKFCDEVRLARNAGVKFPVHDAFRTVTGRNFEDVPQLPGVPYICLRVPTGGGKTLMAAHAVGTVAKRLGRQDRPLCLWVTPSTTIRDQTLRGLQGRDHPYHLALKESLGERPEVLTLEEALTANRSKTDASALIVVTTIQSYRIDEESNRRIYQDNGYLMDHFQNLPSSLQNGLNVNEHGRTPFSFANVMQLLHPIVIMDEAHNARTKTSFDSLARMGPLAVIELTATPIQEHNPAKDIYASNVLHSVSALELKREGMIKLPVDLESRKDWLDVLAATVKTRAMLAEKAERWKRDGGRYVRPIALIQAQPKSKTKETQTVDRVKAALVDKLKVPAESIRIATGETNDLGDEDLNRPDCKVEFVITVEQLREGWDCPFAYVLGSVGNVATPSAVEQLLGRILRMPHATPTGVPELDRAYAIVQSEDVAKTAANLADSLVNRCGFDKQNAGDVFRIHRQTDDRNALPFTSIPVSIPPKLSALPSAIQAKVKYEPDSGTISVRKPLTRDEAKALRDVLPETTDKAAVENYWQAEREFGTVPKKLDQYAEPIRLPQLAVRDGQRFIRFEPIELDEFEWNLDKCDPKFAPTDFSDELQLGKKTIIGVAETGGVRIGGIEDVIVRQQSLFYVDDNWDKPHLVRWLSRELHSSGKFAGLTAAESQAWLIRAVDDLTGERGIAIPIVVRKRHALADLIYHRVLEHGRQQVRNVAKSLYAGSNERRLETTFEMPFVILEHDYAPHRRYSGTFNYQKHAFDLIGEMGNEESQCAKKLDDHPNVYRWLRNLSYESAGGFYLPLSPGKFFPDFIVETNDDRTIIVEYKNSTLAQTKEEQHKKVVGEMWEARSGGTCDFSWILDRDWATLEAQLAMKQGE